MSAEWTGAAAVAVAAVAALVWLLYRRLTRIAASLGQTAGGLRRHQARVQEAELLRNRRAPVVNATSSVAGAVGRGARLTRLGHDVVALAPFAILSAIPRTRRRTEQVKVIHDSISSRVYDAIESTTDQLSQ
ncbi:MAG: hypothetical protein ACSLEW_10775 [Nocardioides sp.]